MSSPEARSVVATTGGDRRIVVVGLGYVGLPLAIAFVEAGVEVTGIDTSPSRIAAIRDARSPIEDISDDQLARALRCGLSASGPDPATVRSSDAVFVCVPTPVTPTKDPDLALVLSAAELVREALRPGHLVVLQSTTYPGTTMGPFRSALEKDSGLVAGQDFDLAFAPERVSPGDPQSTGRHVPRLVGGSTAHATQRAARLLRRINDSVVELTSPDAAEMAKLHENVFRNVNIALVNELALLCERMGIDVWEVIAASATKPFGFMKFSPGPGVGGHCIPVDPYYLAWRAREFDFTDRFIELAADINGSMPRHVIELAAEALNEVARSLRGAKVGVLGVSFKPNVGDAREAPAAHVLAGLTARGALVEYHDPHVSAFRDADGREVRSRELADLIEWADLLVAITHHAAIDWSRVYANAPLVVDTVNSASGVPRRAGKVLRLGAGWMRD